MCTKCGRVKVKLYFIITVCIYDIYVHTYLYIPHLSHVLEGVFGFCFYTHYIPIHGGVSKHPLAYETCKLQGSHTHTHTHRRWMNNYHDMQTHKSREHKNKKNFITFCGSRLHQPTAPSTCLTPWLYTLTLLPLHMYMSSHFWPVTQAGAQVVVSTYEPNWSDAESQTLYGGLSPSLLLSLSHSHCVCFHFRIITLKNGTKTTTKC